MASYIPVALRTRLAQLAALKAEGILTDQEYEGKRAAAIDEIALAPGEDGTDLDKQGRHVNWLGITLASMFVPFFGLYGIYAWITRFSSKRRWQSALIYWSPALVMLALIAIVAAADPQAFDGEGSQPKAGTTSQQFSIGDAWVAAKDGWTITVTEATTTDAFQGGIIGLPHLAQGTYLAVTVRLENTAAGEHALGKNRFKLSDAAGRSYSAAGFNQSFGGGSYGSDISFGEDVIPGGAIEGILFFDVPRAASGLQLHVIGGGAIMLGDVDGGSFMQPAASTRGGANPPTNCDASNKEQCCPQVLEMPATAATQSLVMCVPWAKNSTRFVDWSGIHSTLCERREVEELSRAIADDPVMSTLLC